MTLIAKNTGGGDYTLAPQGTFLARCVQVIDLGTQYSAHYEKSVAKVLLGWELPTERDVNNDNRRIIVWKRYTVSLHEKATLRNDLESWRGLAFTAEQLEGFDLKKVLGVPCQLQIIHSEREGQTYANVSAVIGLMMGTDMPPQVNEFIVYEIDNHNQVVYDAFSDGLKKVIDKSAERKADGVLTQQPQQAVATGAGDQIPF